MTELKTGTRLYSIVCDTEVVVVRVATTQITLQCGGMHMVSAVSPTTVGDPLPPFDTGSILGKRYVNDDVGLEVLCVKPGRGTLALRGEPLALKEAKPLPSSD